MKSEKKHRDKEKLTAKIEDRDRVYRARDKRDKIQYTVEREILGAEGEKSTVPAPPKRGKGPGAGMLADRPSMCTLPNRLMVFPTTRRKEPPLPPRDSS